MTLSVRHALMGCALVFAAAPAVAMPAPSDAQFARNAAQGGLAEVRMARLALRKSTNAVVVAFARRMLHDHTANNAQLAALMRSEGLPVPTMVDPGSQMMMSRLQGLSGAAFNRAYMTGQVKGHGQMQILMQSEANRGKDARLRAFATSTLSVVNQHLAMARKDVAMLRSGHMTGTMSGSMSGGAMSTSPAGGMSSPMPMGSPMPMSSAAPMSSPAPMSSHAPMSSPHR